jgi:hypothetical protein
VINNEKYFNKGLPAGYDGLFDWDYLIPAFSGTKIRPMDVDGLVERNGRFILFETKEPESTIPRGQQITLRALHKLGCFTIFFIEGKKKEEVCKLWILWPADKDPHKIKLDNDDKEPWEIVVDKVKEWFEDADQCGEKTKINPANIIL